MAMQTKPLSGEATVIHTGKVLSIAYSPELIDGVRKQPQEAAQVTRWGIPGDRHYGETRVSHGHVVPNNRPITVCGAEATREVCARLGIENVPPGGLGENFLLEGAGDLGDLEEGDQLRFLSSDGEPEVVLEVRKQNEPCSNLQLYHRLMVKELYGRRGLLCIVLREGIVHLGDEVEIVRPT